MRNSRGEKAVATVSTERISNYKKRRMDSPCDRVSLCFISASKKTTSFFTSARPEDMSDAKRCNVG